MLSKLFLVDSIVFSLFKAILKTTGRHSANGKKDNAVYTGVSERILTDKVPAAVLKEETIEQHYKDSEGKTNTLQLRRIAWWDADGEKVYEFITNNFELVAQVIADIYRYRWRIELFFKKLKQNFPLHYFLEDNQNAVEI